MKRSLPLPFLLALSLVFLFSCVPVRVVYVDQDANAQLNNNKTFAFYQTGMVNNTDLEPYQENIRKLKTAIKKEMMARGYSLNNNPDLLINIGIYIEEKVQTRETDIRDAPRYVGQRNYKWESEIVEVHRYKEGTVVVDLVDAASNELVWEGAAAGTITKNQDKMEKRINQAMARLFKKLPAVDRD